MLSCLYYITVNVTTSLNPSHFADIGKQYTAMTWHTSTN